MLFRSLIQFLLVFGLVLTTVEYGYNFSPYGFAGAMIGFSANLVLLRILFTNAEKKELESRLQKLEQMQELERARFESIEVRQFELAKIRHDFGNQLVTAYRLVDQNKHKEAAGLLDALSAAVEDTRERVYCANTVVNAVLFEKHIVCEIADITLDINVELAEDCGIKQLHLCSIFSNLLDNAINACRDLPNSVITLMTLHKGDYLHIKCTNPTLEDDNVKPERGYGTRIISDIAEQYEGVYSIEINKGQYSAIISLMCM